MISVCVAIYNAEKTIEKCINSIRLQTFSDLEIILVDDGSKDRTAEICKKYSKLDERIHYYFKENGGLSSTRNYGLEKANGEYIIFVDGDDWLEFDMLDYLYSKLTAHKADISICQYFVDTDGSASKIRSYISQECELSAKDALQILVINNEYATWNRLCKKKIYDAISFPLDNTFEERSTTWKAILKADNVVFLPEAKYHYVNNDNSLSKKHEMKQLKDLWVATKERYEALQPLLPEAEIYLLSEVSMSAGRMWAWFYELSDADKKELRDSGILNDINAFIKKNYRKLITAPSIIIRPDNKVRFSFSALGTNDAIMLLANRTNRFGSFLSKKRFLK